MVDNKLSAPIIFIFNSKRLRSIKTGETLKNLATQMVLDYMHEPKFEVNIIRLVS